MKPFRTHLFFAAGGTLFGATAVSGIYDTTWIATSFVDPVSDVERLILPGTEITFQVESSGDVHGNAGCNGYFGGGVQVDGSNITMPGGFATTRMYCSPDYVMEQEYSYLQSLVRASNYAIDDEEGNLRLTDETGSFVAEYEPYSAADPIDVPPTNCKGASLHPGEILEPNDAICSDNFTFGVTKKGKLMLFNQSNGDVIWQAVNNIGCVFGNCLKVKSSGKLMFYVNSPIGNTTVWGRKCDEDHLKLKLTDNALKFYKQGEISWKVKVPEGQEMNVAGCEEFEDDLGMIPL